MEAQPQPSLPEPVIEFDPHIALQLMTYAWSTTLEFSGFGFVERTGRVFRVYDFELLNVGSTGYTEIPAEKVAALSSTRPDADKMRLWIHRHPVGNGIPGSHNWSTTDQTTCTQEPLGSPAALTKWALAVVITPRGWVGRLDSFADGAHAKTRHLKVLPDVLTLKSQIEELLPKKAVVYRAPAYQPGPLPPDFPGLAPEPQTWPPQVNYPVWNQEELTPTRLSGWSEYGDTGYENYSGRYNEDFFGGGASGYELEDTELTILEWIDEFGPDTTLGELANQFGLRLIPDTYYLEDGASESEQDDGSHPPQRNLQRFYNLGWLGRSWGNRGGDRPGPGKDRDYLP